MTKEEKKKIIELVKIQREEVQAWEAWKKSKEHSHGDPECLDIISRCIERRCEILDLVPHRGE